MKDTLEVWAAMRPGCVVTDEQIASLLAEAEVTTDVHPADWFRLRDLLMERGGMTAKDADRETRRAKIVAELGCYPYTAEELVPAFLRRHRYALDYSGRVKAASGLRDAAYVQNQMIMWASQVWPSKPVSRPELIVSAFANWQADEKERLLRVAYDHLAFRRDANPDELSRFAAHITAPGEDQHATARNVAATRIALANFVYRTKNHMRGVWKHSAHLMPILFGEQGSSKSTAIQSFLSPLGELTTIAGFDLFSHTSREYELSIMPVVFFDELAGIGKADVEKLKGIMTASTRQFRQSYQAACVRTVMSTFIGATNRDIRNLIKDETGNRRFLQITTPRLDRASFKGFDYLAIWRSVDENAAEPPMYDGQHAADIITDVQSEQEFRGVVRSWVEEAGHDKDAKRLPELFLDFQRWAEVMYPAQARYMDLTTFGLELKRLWEAKHPLIVRKRPGNVVHYRIVPPAPLAANSNVLSITFTGAA